MNFGKSAGKTISVFSNNAWLIIKMSAVFVLMSVISLSLLAPSMFAGLGGAFLKIHKGEKARISDLFTHVSKTFRLFTAALVVLLVSAATIVFIFMPVAVLALWMYVVFIMAEGEKGLGEALSLSARAVVEKDFLGHLIAALVLCIINATGIALAGIGLIITIPLTAGFIAFCYEEILTHAG